jgi:hypothetical protein
VRALALTLLLLGLTGCGPEPPEPLSGAEAAALELFRLARLSDAERGQAAGPLDPAIADEPRAALYDALDSMAALEEPRIVAVEPLPDVGRTAVDLSVGLAGGGSARFSVQLEAVGEETWVVRWFQGPGVEWPPPRRRRDPGLSSSHPPER